MSFSFFPQDLFLLNQHLLNAVGVGHPVLGRVCEMASRAGLAAKLTGAGGGGCAIVLVPPGRDGREGGREEGRLGGWVTGYPLYPLFPTLFRIL